ncbi:tripartite tricarboxylate transporter substrate binding protein [Bordetella sp. BOR01]|uniref:Bug family tripartite tricarboxylate transporter substrate binding protein n=1 Tax=Bordetella sp. BOR01 TaxID=2854779 RepID=UPI001C453C39|nr:tripartite tricarboxylate transporter substrate binding protein [Bordetella sp. BOR01]MBV7484074.1 tripartite tricarboxylate transporter substrate binding protein [Bordetella sp. BOR01]
MFIFKTFLRLFASLALVVGTAAHAAYPEKPITLIVPFPSGGGTDATARLIAGAISPILGVNTVVENRAGAAGSIGAQAVANAKPDGYTLFFTTTGALVINPHLYKNLRYSTDDFTPIAPVGESANVLVVNPDVPAKSVQELIALAKASPGKYTYGSSGVGSSSHLAGVMLESLTGIQLTHVPYKGSAPAVTDLIGGRIDMMIDNIPSHVEFAKAGKVRPLGVSGTKASPLFPGVPTIAQAGVPGYDVSIWYGILGPAGMPDDIVQKIAAAVRQVLENPDLRAKLVEIGSDPMIMAPKEFAAFIGQENEKWAGIVKQSGATLD